jgi:hypothetical protein
VRNLFDQYDQPENKLTHALVCTLQSDPKLIRPFLKKCLRVRGDFPKRKIQIVEQQVPGESVSGNESESKGLPDACFYDNNRWAVLLESKVQAGISLNQLERHNKTAKRYGYENSAVVLISVDQPKKSLPSFALSMEWREVYGWFNKQASNSARIFVEYMRVFESQMIARKYNIRGTITMFDGLHFHKEPYTYEQGKRLIRLFTAELKLHPGLRELGIDPKGEGRPAIKGSGQDGVWNFLSLKRARRAKQFTSFPHFTIGVKRDYASAALTIPNGMKGGFKRKLNQEGGQQRFQELMVFIEKQLRPIIRETGAKPIIYAHQRHYATQSSLAETDAKLVADLRTFISGSKSKVKFQPQWLDAIYHVLCQKESNIQLGVEVQSPYGSRAVASQKIVDCYAKAWIAMKPLLDFVLKDD